ncbi:MAG: hypothetical protein AB7F35_00620 [Acetobacteraceae bacterium]
MTATVTQSGLYAFAGIHVCSLTEGDTVQAFDRLPLHYSPKDTVAILPEYLDALVSDGWAAHAEQAQAETEEPSGPATQPEGEAEADAAEAAEPEAAAEDQPEEKAATPVEANKAARPVAENKAHKKGK